MSYVPYRRRQHRASSLSFAPGAFSRLLSDIRRPAVLFRLGMAILAGIIMWLVTGAWAPPFSYRTGYIPPRNIIAKTDFKLPDNDQTARIRDAARDNVPSIYDNDPKKLIALRQDLLNLVSQIVLAESLDTVDRNLWLQLVGPGSTEEVDKERFAALKTFFSASMSADNFGSALTDSLADFEQTGLISKLTHLEKANTGSKTKIAVRRSADSPPQVVEVNEVLIPDIGLRLKQRLAERLRMPARAPGSADSPTDPASVVADIVFAYLYPVRLPTTLTWNEADSSAAIKKAVDGVAKVYREYHEGVDQLAVGGKPLTEKDILILREEYKEARAKLGWSSNLQHSLATFGLYFAMYVLCGFYIYHRRRKVLSDLWQFTVLLSSVVITVIACWFGAFDQWRVELIPLMLFGMTAAIAYEKELALLLSAAVALVVAFSLEQGLAEFVILVSSVAATVLLFRRIRSRTKLIYVGAFTGIVVVLTTIGVGVLVGQSFGASNFAITLFSENATDIDIDASFFTTLLAGAGWFGFCSVLAGLLMTGLLPFIERIYDVQTDISLLELGDVQHPLLQELVRRAPGTYNHSINVASIAETAADAIGANGLLVRVGAYFHDVGKMLKPSYFVENQGSEGNRHDSLQPAMSSLVIIAHVKDGADLARQYHLPQSIIDFIFQHHGTTLVEYFYRREAKRLEADPDAGELDEGTFRYPGPKPQTKEAGVLMLSDVVESASRALVDPTPSRIESLVHDLSMKRLLDGQFDECGITLRELRAIEDSLVKSLTAVYHGRVKYPEHQTV